MKLHYYPETDSLYIELNAAASTATREIVTGLNVDFDATGAIVGLDIDGAARQFDLTSLEAVDLPLASLRAA